jgi:hypothetical protein
MGIIQTAVSEVHNDGLYVHQLDDCDYIWEGPHPVSEMLISRTSRPSVHTGSSTSGGSVGENHAFSQHHMRLSLFDLCFYTCLARPYTFVVET